MLAKNAGILVQTVHFSGNLNANESKRQDGAAASSLANDEADAVYPLYPPDEITVFWRYGDGAMPPVEYDDTGTTLDTGAKDDLYVGAAHVCWFGKV